MNIKSKLGKVRFEISFSPLAAGQAERDLMAANHLLFHKAGSKARPDSYSDASAGEVKAAIAEAFKGLFSLDGFEHSEYVDMSFERDIAATRKSLAGILPQAEIDAIIAKKVAAKQAKAPAEAKAESDVSE